MSHSNTQGRNSGWQVWGTATPSSTRKLSLSSAASDLQPSPADSNYRGHLRDGWTTSRSPTGAWDDANEVPPKKEFSQMESHTSLSLHHRNIAVTQTAFPGPRTDDRVVATKSGRFSPHQYDGGLGTEAGAPKFPASASPTSHFGADVHPSPQSSTHNVVTAASYSSHKSSVMTEDLTVAFRGMAVEDDHNVRQNRQHVASSQSVPHHRGHSMHQPRPYGGYSDYNPYYAVRTVREPYIDFSYGYDAYRGPTDATMYPSLGISGASPSGLYPPVVSQGFHPNAVPDIHRPQQGVFFDYGAAPHPASQFYYPTHQPVMYPPPTHSPMTASQLPVTLADKKREMQYNVQQHIPSQNVMYGPVRSTLSTHPQAYGAPGLEYGSQIPMMAPRVLYGHGPRHVHPHKVRSAGRGGIHQSTAALRSHILDEFRGSKTRKWELRDIFGFIVEFSGDQHGSRFIQQKLESATTEEKQIIFDEIVPDNILQLIQDLFGNYVIQKLLEHGTQVQKTVLANAMEGHVLSLSLQMYGCRVVQKAIEYILPDQQSMFVRELEPHVLRCVKDSNGNHVIQKLIERVCPERLTFVGAFRGKVYDLSTHPYGCRVLQRCLEHLPADYTHMLIDDLHRYTVNLMQDQFGNYVIQYVLEHGRPQDRALVISKLCGQVLHLSRHKFASNVVEKALVCADANSRRMLIDEMMTATQDGVSPIIAMMKDQFANYVLQRALTVADRLQREALINEVRPHLASMRRLSSASSKHLSSIERLVENHPGPSHQRVSTPQLAIIPPPDSGG